MKLFQFFLFTIYISFVEFLFVVTGCSTDRIPDNHIEYLNQTNIFLDNDSSLVIHPIRFENGSVVAIIPSWWDETHIVVTPEDCIYAETIEYRKTSQPVISIQTASGSMDVINADKKNEESGYLRVWNKDGSVEYDSLLTEIKGRGNLSWKQNKRPYNIKLAVKCKLLDLHKSDEFCLLADAMDPCHLRNFLVLETARKYKTSSPVSCQYITLFLNGDYSGLYLLTEKVKIGKSSINIQNLAKKTEEVNDKKLKKFNSWEEGFSSKISPHDGFSLDANAMKGIEGANNPKDITGGYLLDQAARCDVFLDSPSGFISGCNVPIIVKDPKWATAEQVKYISGQYNELEESIRAENGINIETHKHYSEYLNIQSFVKYYLIQEVFLNQDGGKGSFKMYKDRDDKDSLFHAGSLWDFDHAMNNPYSLDICKDPRALYVFNGFANHPSSYRGILGELCQHREFMDSVRDSYRNELRSILDTLFYMGEVERIYSDIKADVHIDALVNNESLSSDDDKDNILSFMQSRINMLDRIWLEDNNDNCIIHLDAKFTDNAFYHGLLFLHRRGEPFVLPVINKNYYDEAYQNIGYFDVETGEKFNSGTAVIRDLDLEICWKQNSSRRQLLYYLIITLLTSCVLTGIYYYLKEKNEKK